MNKIIILINERLRIIEQRASNNKNDTFTGPNFKYLKQLQSEYNFLDDLKEIIIKENKK